LLTETRTVDKIDIDHPVEAAKGRPVFEVYPLTDASAR
jgi:hypothetical protein